jgi:hypothetical protein
MVKSENLVVDKLSASSFPDHQRCLGAQFAKDEAAHDEDVCGGVEKAVEPGVVPSSECYRPGSGHMWCHCKIWCKTIPSKNPQTQSEQNTRGGGKPSFLLRHHPILALPTSRREGEAHVIALVIDLRHVTIREQRRWPNVVAKDRIVLT